MHSHDVDILTLHQAFEELTELDERHGKIVELRFFGGKSPAAGTRGDGGRGRPPRAGSGGRDLTYGLFRGTRIAAGDPRVARL